MKDLTYNQVWEDYEVDRIALGINPGETILLIASGGCNALNTLLEDPGEIYAVDRNSAQIRLLDEKVAAMRRGYADLWNAFGIPAQQRQNSIYSQGAYARFRWVRRFFQAACGKGIRKFLDAPDLETQATIYIEEIEPKLWRLPVRFFPTAFAGICGMHWRQVLYSAQAGQFFLEQACRERLRNVLTQHPIRANYYWHQMLAGHYCDGINAPAYLRECNFTKIEGRIERVRGIHSDLLTFLRQSRDNTFARANMLDVFEFVSVDLRNTLLRELHRVCKPDATLLFRTFAPRLAINGVSRLFKLNTELSQKLSGIERTASYGGVHVYSVVK